jgi:hypothetical protein
MIPHWLATSNHKSSGAVSSMTAAAGMNVSSAMQDIEFAGFG